MTDQYELAVVLWERCNEATANAILATRILRALIESQVLEQVLGLSLKRSTFARLNVD